VRLRLLLLLLLLLQLLLLLGGRRAHIRHLLLQPGRVVVDHSRRGSGRGVVRVVGDKSTL
jgi:hypothetical protein